MIRPTCCMPWLRDTLPKTLVAMTSRTSIRVLRAALRLSELVAATGSRGEVYMGAEMLWSRQNCIMQGTSVGAALRPAPTLGHEQTNDLDCVSVLFKQPLHWRIVDADMCSGH